MKNLVMVSNVDKRIRILCGEGYGVEILQVREELPSIIKYEEIYYTGTKSIGYKILKI